MTKSPQNILAIDLGKKRVGLAIASSLARLPRPLGTLPNSAQLIDQLTRIINQEAIGVIVLGWPRNLNSQDTEQTRYTAAFHDQLAARLQLPIHLQDEALTSRQAEAELSARGKPYDKPDIDALAAVYILEYFLSEQREAV